MPKNGGPVCPKVDRLEELMEYLTSVKQDTREGDQDETSVQLRTDFNNTIQECVEALDWLHTSLSNRKTYHQKRQLLQKAESRIAREMLSPDELENIRKQVEKEMGNG